MHQQLQAPVENVLSYMLHTKVPVWNKGYKMESHCS